MNIILIIMICCCWWQDPVIMNISLGDFIFVCPRLSPSVSCFKVWKNVPCRSRPDLVLVPNVTVNSFRHWFGFGEMHCNKFRFRENLYGWFWWTTETDQDWLWLSCLHFTACLSGDAENAGLENAGPNRRGGKRKTGKRGTKFAGVENAGQACMEREMTKNRKFSLIDNRVV